MADSPRTRSFRIVCPTGLEHLVETLLRSQGFSIEPDPVSPWARRVTCEPFPLGRSIAAFFGLIYIQDRSSMLPPLALAPPLGGAILDMCASPGSKTGLLAQLVGPDGFVMGNEPNSQRLTTLRQNLFTLSLPHTATCSYPGEALPLPDGSWQHIQLDPPCSGWGTVEKNPRALTLWQGQKIKPLIHTQRCLLQKAAKLLAPGGTLVYSTCTTNIQENEDQAHWAQEELGLTLEPLPFFEGFTFDAPSRPDCDGTLRVRPAPGNAQGFYIARFRKPGNAPVKTPGTRISAHYIHKNTLQGACTNPDMLPHGEIALFNNKAFFLPRQALTMLPASFKWRGYPLGKTVREVVRPSPRLRCLMPPLDTCPQHAVNLNDPEQLTALISGQSIDLRTGDHKKRALGSPASEAGLYFRELPLGRVRIKGHRALWCGG